MRMNDVEPANLLDIAADLPEAGNVRRVWLAAHRHLEGSQPLQSRKRVPEGLFRAQIGVNQMHPAAGTQESFGKFDDVTPRSSAGCFGDDQDFWRCFAEVMKLRTRVPDFRDVHP
jgi:hypothetical protein